jgi:hypothetical protein
MKDGLLRHPADAPFWTDFDSRYPDFAKDSRNLRLAVAAVGDSPEGPLKQPGKPHLKPAKNQS